MPLHNLPNLITDSLYIGGAQLTKVSEKLKEIGIATPLGLLRAGASARGRQDIANRTGISHLLILKWVNHVDLFRVKGVGPESAELLEAAGVDTIKEFRNRVPENLHPKLLEVNTAKHLTGRVPSVEQLAEMIAIAKTLEPKITYSAAHSDSIQK